MESAYSCSLHQPDGTTQLAHLCAVQQQQQQGQSAAAAVVRVVVVLLSVSVVGWAQQLTHGLCVVCCVVCVCVYYYPTALSSPGLSTETEKIKRGLKIIRIAGIVSTSCSPCVCHDDNDGDVKLSKRQLDAPLSPSLSQSLEPNHQRPHTETTDTQELSNLRFLNNQEKLKETGCCC